jgi:alkylation response protein AidB-like acyl-CoA dehydrogenase
VSLSLQDVKVPAIHRLGEEGDGFKIALGALDTGRIGVAAQALGVMCAAFEESVRYAQQRHAFGGPLSKIQAVQFKLAEMERRIACAKLLIQRAGGSRTAAGRIARGIDGESIHAVRRRPGSRTRDPR